MSDDRRPVGLLAGAGRFPISFAVKARSLGLPVSCVGLTGHADPVLERLCWRFHWSGIAKLGRMIRLFKADGVDHVVMAGKVQKAEVMYHPWRAFRFLPDWRAVKAYYLRPRQDNKDDTLMLTLIDEFEKDGLTFASALDLCPELLVKPGVLTRRRLTAAEQADVEFGWQLAKKMGELDVGQSVAVKELNVLAVEAVEGTDRAILRAGELCRAGGFTVVKVAKPQQDMRFDVPTVGCTTIETLHKARGRVLAIEADRTILLDHEETVALADRLGICIVAVQPSLVGCSFSGR
jgi:UDP-2,3-diacylglucosamine hydrolase